MAERFQATARIPTRPLSYANKDLAENKEILVDYDNHAIYIKVDDEFYDITCSISEVVSQVIAQLEEDPTILQSIFNSEDNQETITNISITLDDGTVVTISSAIIDALTRIEELEEQLGIIRDSETGEITNITINSTDVAETDEKQFVSATEKETWNNKAEIVTENVTIAAGSSNWSGSSAPYTQTVTMSSMKSTYYPIVDVVLSTTYATAMEELNSYAYIYKILTYDGYITVYATNPTEVALTLQMKIDK